METAHSVVLPGGVSTSEGIKSEVRFQVLNGHIEEHLAEFVNQALSPMAVTQLLASVLESVDGMPLNEEIIHDMCIADRQVLMLSLATLLDADHTWLKSDCPHCQTSFDVGFQRSTIPLSMAGEGYPVVETETGLGTVSVRVPTGRDQEAIAGLSDQEAIERLFQRCTTGVEADRLSEQDRQKVEQVLEDIVPELATEIQTLCPECGQAATLNFNPYHIPELDAETIYEDIHCLAFHYHWSEEDILQLSRNRRRRYIAMIDSQHGIHS